MKIVITEGGHSTNVGSMALIENAIRIARTANPDVSISVFCSDAQGVDSFLKHDGEDKNVSVFPDLFSIPSGGNIIKFFGCCSVYYGLRTVDYYFYLLRKLVGLFMVEEKET